MEEEQEASNAATTGKIMTNPARWDHSKHRTGDQQQWNDLAREWLALTPRERHPYHEPSAQRPQPDASLPIPEQYDRVLIPFQTVRERDRALWAQNGCRSPIWLRTCYKADLVEKYADISPSDQRYGMVREDLILDDKAIYGHFATDWAQILLRVPSLPDSVQYLGDADFASIVIPEEGWDEPEEEYQRTVHEATKVVATMMYLADEEALRENVVKLMWLDSHGNCVWDNKLRPEDIPVFEGPLESGFSLSELVARFDSSHDHDHPAYERGFTLRFYDEGD
ncbi:hypothetical protein V493_01761 [Pseudogymnoascus sp. VKM F-4281 (FW-2241)]|nr:hypothetical protein V493_01761 [Pseudogymnoascus sp. VKM F-4281 (FW-2241)]